MTEQKQRFIEPLLTEDKSRWVQLPIKYQKLQDAYETHLAAFWVPQEIDYSSDLNDWNKLTNDERYFIENILGFFAGSDGIVLENINLNFAHEVKASEARNFYAFQAMIENIHGMTYALLIDTFVKDQKRKDELFNAIEQIPAVKKKGDWAIKWFDNSRTFEERIVAFGIVEGIYFSGAFCALAWMKSRNLMTKALGKSNELISRDEGLHTSFAVLMYEHLLNKVSQDRAEEIFREAVEIEIEFITESIPCKMIGMNADLMIQYIKYVADRLLNQFGFKKIYKETNPFSFMENLSLDSKTNFFENTVTEYKHAASADKTEASWDFNSDDEF